MIASPEEIHLDLPFPLKGQQDSRKKRLLVEINDEVTSTQVSDLRHGLRALIEKSDLAEWKDLYLDMRSARMVDSMGINWLHAEAVRLQEIDKKMVIRISSPAINRVMQFAGLDKVVTLKFRRRKQTR